MNTIGEVLQFVSQGVGVRDFGFMYRDEIAKHTLLELFDVCPRGGSQFQGGWAGQKGL